MTKFLTRLAHGVGRRLANLSLRGKGLVIVVIALVPMCMALLALLLAEWYSGRATAVLNEANALHTDGQRLTASMRRAWNGVRKYHRSNDHADLEAYRRLRERVAAHLASIDRHAAQRNLDPAKTKRVRELTVLAQEQIDHLYREGPFLSAEDLVIRLTGLLDAIRETMSQIEREQEPLTAEANARAERVRKWTYAIVPFCVLLGIAGGVIASLIAVSGFVRRIQTLREDASALEQGLPVLPRDRQRDELGQLEESLYQASNLLIPKSRELQELIEARTAELDQAKRDRDAVTQMRNAVETLLESNHRTLEMIALGAPLIDVLTAIARMVDLQIEGGKCAIHLLEANGKVLTLYAAPALGPGLQSLLASRPIAEGTGPWADSVTQRERIVIEDFSNDPGLATLGEKLLLFQYRSAWINPILALDGTPLGTFTVFHTQPHTPDRAEIRAIHRASHSVRVAVERRGMERELVASAERSRLLVESTSDMISLIDANGTILYHSPAVTHILGYTPAERLGKNAFDLMHPDEKSQARANFQRVVESPGIHPAAERRLRHKDGSWRVLEIVINNLLNEPALGCLMVCSRDITGRRRAEMAMMDSEERYRELFENANDILLTYELTGNITSVNRACEIATGYAREDLLQMNIMDLTAPAFHDIHRQTLARQIGGEWGTTFEVELVSKSGALTPVELNTRLIFRDGKPVGVQAIGRDVTERRQLETQLRQAQKMEAIGLLAGGVAHDFNNLLTVISGHTQWMLDDMDESSPLRESASEVLLAANRAAALTGQLLAFSRNQVIQPTEIDLNQLVANMDRMLRRLIGEDIEMVTLMSPDLPAVRVDGGQIEQVILNLVLNARDAMPHGGRLSIETAEVELDDAYSRVHLQCTPGRYIMLAVSDSGSGMDARTRARIFEPFFTTKEVGKGTGLGLSTAYGIVKQSGGYIWVYSEPGLGTVFKVYLPAAVPAAQIPAGYVERNGHGAGTETILLVEDDNNVRRMLRDILRRQGYTILEAADGHVAQRIFESHRRQIHLLVSDVVMPEVGGRQLADRLQSMNGELKVLFMSGYTDDGIMRQRVLEPGTAFLQKPFTPDTLARKVREVLDKR